MARAKKDALEIPAFLLRKPDGSDPSVDDRPDFQDRVYPVTGLPDGDVRWMELYWVAGDIRAAAQKPQRLNDVSDPPNAGWGRALVIGGKGKHLTAFSPYSMQAYQLTADGLEMHSARDLSYQFKRGLVVDKILAGWRRGYGTGGPTDYDMAALALQRLGEPVPTSRPVTSQQAEGEPARPSGGKEPASCLLKRVPPDGKRGKFLAWFMEKEGRSVREAMAEFGMTRSNALSYWFALNKDHGIGYQLVGDAVMVTLPPGCEDPFTGEEPF